MDLFEFGELIFGLPKFCRELKKNYNPNDDSVEKIKSIIRKFNETGIVDPVVD